MRTSSEIETISKRASRAAGFTWGISEEIGKCIKSLELYQISGLENLYDYLKMLMSYISLDMFLSVFFFLP